MRNNFIISRPKFITNIGQLALPKPFSDRVPNQPISILENVWVRIENGVISEIGPASEPFPNDETKENNFDANGRLATPGLIDSHTHPVFRGYRQQEFLRRCKGETYQQIAEAGGGILNSIRGVRNAGEDELKQSIKGHLDRFLQMGVTTIEGKSGYGLSVDSEIKSLRALKDVAMNHPIDVSSTLLAAHVIPPEFKANPDGYVNLICEEIIPLTIEHELAESIDIFLDDGAFNSTYAKTIFESAQKHNMMIKMHADQFRMSNGAELAAEYNAISADHMDYTTIDGLALMSKAGVSLNMLPGAVFFLGLDQYASGRDAIDCGCNVALSTDFNPGSSPTQSLPMMMTLACLKMGISADEALWACTMGGAKVINRHDSVGALDIGYKADICLWDAPDVAYIPYSYANIFPDYVIKGGIVMSDHGGLITDNIPSE
jgi:imidazolonepropionase